MVTIVSLAKRLTSSSRRGTLPPRSQHSLLRYGLSVSDWQKMLDRQGGGCAICGKGGRYKHLSVDHDHRVEREVGTILVRGLLCQRCNRALGAFEWDYDVMKRAINYMRRAVENAERIRKEKLNG